MTNVCSYDVEAPEAGWLDTAESEDLGIRRLGGVRHRGATSVARPHASAGAPAIVAGTRPRSHSGRRGPQRCGHVVTSGSRAARRRGHVGIGIVAAALVVALALPWGGAGGRPLATSGPARAGAPVVPHALYIVQPGDTLWTIAQQVAPGADPRVVEGQLAAQVRGETIVPGERLVLP